MEALKRRVATLLERLKGNEAGDRSQSARLDSLELRMADAERKIGKRAKTLDADE